MTMTTLDPMTALIVIDMQRGIAFRDDLAPHPTAQVIDRIGELVSAFRAHDLPVVMVNVAGIPPGRTDRNAGQPARTIAPESTEFIDQLTPEPGDIVVTKHSRSAFVGTGLVETLRARGVTQVVVVGIASGAGVESTGRDAHEAGFHVSLPTDAMTDSSAERHAHSVESIFPQIAETGSTADVLTLLPAGAARRQ